MIFAVNGNLACKALCSDHGTKTFGDLSMATKNRYHANSTSAISEVYLRQLTVDEALIKLEKHLNDAFMAGLDQIRVIPW